ncbi:MAG: VOC family protein, partial [Chloroflexota bacterium]|nr:VOC family protein [Chloroflexota bacterium]
MARGIDHVVIGVRDLARASADYAALGFTVTPGGEHAGGATHNALVSFTDGTYLELIAFTEPDRPQDHRWWDKIAAGGGLVDFALCSDDVAADAARLEGAGVSGAAVQEGGRLRPDGQRVGWRNLVVDHPAAPLPFLIEDVTPRELRVPGGAAAEHPLGVSGVAGLSLVVADRDAAAAAFAAFLGTPG